MDPWRQQILADIGIPTWIRRELLPAVSVAEVVVDTVASAAPVSNPGAQNPKPQTRTPDTAAGSALAALAQSLDSGSASRARAGSTAASSMPPNTRHETGAGQTSPQAQLQNVKYPEVACLWNGDAVLFCPPHELHGQVRLVKDILASAANNWTGATEQVVFRWAELQASGFDPAEADRALLAFAEKRIEVSAARWVLSTPTLQPLLAQLVLPTQARLVGLAELANLARNAALKQRLWQAMQNRSEAPGTDG